MECTICRGSKTVKFLDLGRQPLANKYPTKEQIASEDFFPLEVFFCGTCRNVQLGRTISRERMFEDYYYLSSVNLGLVRHFEALAKKLASAAFVVDVGSNDGILLKPLRDLGVKAVGIDPSINVSKIANDAGLTTITSFFNESAVREVVKKWGKPDTIVASSIFTHLEDPHAFLDDVMQLLADRGSFIVEVEYIGNILEGVQFERFYLDRVFYYSLASLKHVLSLHDMYISDVEMIEPHGGSIRVTAQKRQSRSREPRHVERFLVEEERVLHGTRLKEFSKRVDSHIAAFRDKLNGYKRKKLRVAGYGAPARVATICNYGDIGPSLIEYIVDDSPLKQNRYSPGTHIPIVERSHLERRKPDVLVVFAHEYLDDIKKKASGFRYLIPIPTREVV